MSRLDGKYMVNLMGVERWQGWYFDSSEEAKEEAIRVLKEEEMDSDVFGDTLDSLLVWENGQPIIPESFMLGIVKSPAVPYDLGSDILTQLDEGYWSDYAFDGDWISDYAFTDREIAKLNQIIRGYIKEKVDESGYYIVDNIVEVYIEQKPLTEIIKDRGE